MDLGLSDKSAVVLASTTGLGFAVARALAGEGARVAISGRKPERLQSALDALQAHGARVWGETLDVTDLPALGAHLTRARERFGAVDILVINAGGPPAATAGGVTLESLDSAYLLLLKSAVHAVRTVLPWMRARRWGRIIGMTSIAVREPIPDLALSNTMRAGLTGYLKSLADEVAADGILVNTVCTGAFATDRLLGILARRAQAAGRSLEEERRLAEQQIPVRRFGKPEEFGALVAFLASARASFLTGAAIPIHGGAGRSLL